MFGRRNKILQRLGILFHALDGDAAVVRLLSAIRLKRRIIETDKVHPRSQAALDPRNAVVQAGERPRLSADGALPDDGILFVLRRRLERALPLFADGRQAVERLRLRAIERDDELCPLIRLSERRKECILRLPLRLPAAQKRTVRGNERIGKSIQEGEVHFAALFKRLDCLLPRNERLRFLVPFQPEEVLFPVVDGLRRDAGDRLAERKGLVQPDRLCLFADDDIFYMRQNSGDRPVLPQDEVPAHIVDDGISVLRKLFVPAAAEKIVIFTKRSQHTSSFAYAPTSITPSRIFGR